MKTTLDEIGNEIDKYNLNCLLRKTIILWHFKTTNINKTIE